MLPNFNPGWIPPLSHGEDEMFPKDRVTPLEPRPFVPPVVHSLGTADFKDTNPKDSVGTRKAPMSTVPAEVLAELAVAMLEGARKYARHNYRVVGILASVYYDAAMRHMMQWWEGEDLDPDSGVHHVTKAIASLVVLRDAMITKNFSDDRPPRLAPGWMNDLNAKSATLIDKYPDAKPAYTEENRGSRTQV